jgi:hypothetical protein
MGGQRTGVLAAKHFCVFYLCYSLSCAFPVMCLLHAWYEYDCNESLCEGKLKQEWMCLYVCMHVRTYAARKYYLYL